MQQIRKVSFIGAGPGDPQLITVKAVNALRKAEVVIVDRLVSEDILTEYVPFTAQIIPVGKQGRSEHSTSQTEINELLVEKASQYNNVVRLKGGDLSLFSNILDELLALNKAGFAYELIPGITALSGASAYTGVPLTARAYATGVRVLTYYKNTVIEQSEWQEMAKMKDTLVFYMSGAALPDVVSQLLANGADASLPFLIVEQATTPKQFVHKFSLTEFLQMTDKPDFVSPSLVIIGKVAALYSQFAWLPNQSDHASYFLPLDTITELFNDVKNANNVSRA